MLGTSRFNWNAALMAAGSLAIAVSFACSASWAQDMKPAQKPGGPPARDARKDPAESQRAYAAGTRAFESGNLTAAIQQLSVALAGGGLANPQMARALYLRGSAYRQQGKPAQAISDLTTALWLKNGLAGADKAKAAEMRQAAYQEAGLGDVAPPVGAAATIAAVKSEPAKVAAAPSPPQPKPGAQVATAPAQSSIWNILPSPPALPNIFSSGEKQAATSEPAPAAPAPAVAEPATAAPAMAQSEPAPTSGWDASATPAREASPPVGFAQATPDAAPQASPEASSSPATTVAGFFGNLFGGSNSAPQATTQPSSPVMTGATAAPQAGSAFAAPSSPQTSTPQTSSMVQRSAETPPETLPWAGQAQPGTVATAATSAPSRAIPPAAPVARPTVADAYSPPPAAAPAPPAQMPARPTPPMVVASAEPAAQPGVAAKQRRQLVQPGGGKFKLQVAAVRSREQAEQVAQAIIGLPEVAGGGVQPEVEEAAFGASGTFYRVRLGPYADAISPNQLCKSLRPQGYDCLVVSQ